MVSRVNDKGTVDGNEILCVVLVCGVEIVWHTAETPDIYAACD